MSDTARQKNRRRWAFRVFVMTFILALVAGAAITYLAQTPEDGEDTKMASAIRSKVITMGRRTDRLRYKLRRIGAGDAQAKPGLVFLHHSAGNDLMHRGLDAALLAKDYVGTVNGITYGTDLHPDEGRPDSLRNESVPGNYTDMNHWVSWFNDYLGGIKSYGRNGDPNSIVMFKSCFPNSNIVSDGDTPEPFDETRTLANYKAIFRHPDAQGQTYTHGGKEYKPLEQIFAENPDTLFIAVAAPPMHFGPSDPTKDDQASRARAFNTWVENEWLAEYNTAHPGLNNVAVFNWFDLLAYPSDHSSHPNRLTAPYGGAAGDSHPNRKAAKDTTKAFATAPDNFIDKAWTAFQASQARRP